MRTIRFFVIFFLFASVECRQPQHNVPASTDNVKQNENKLQTSEQSIKAGNGALLLTRFKSLADFEAVVQVQYFGDTSEFRQAMGKYPFVLLTYRSGDRAVSSLLKGGISQADFIRARNGSLWDRALLGLKCPFAVIKRKDLACIENLGRRKPETFGIGDAAFYDLAEITVSHIVEEDRLLMSAEDLSEKGYLNTFNHVTAQAFMTSIFAERVADFVADVHELYNMPQLITGNFTEKQLADFVDGPVDNYIDMLNNEWGQELGKGLRKKYKICRSTHWTPELLTNYLNDIQSYYSWSFQIGFTPFRATDDKVMRFADKINRILADG